MLRIIVYRIVFCFLVLTSLYANGQDVKSEKDTIQNFSSYKRNFSIRSLFIAEYKASLTSNVDMNGLHNSEGVKSNDGFYLRYVRVSGNYQLNDKISASMLVNLADFKNDPQTRVLENAFIRYTFSNYASFYVGQFRPFFGREDMYPAEYGPSYVWSNQYTEFGANGWQSFQLGIALTGSLIDIGLPLNYYFSMVNGNGKNQVGDDDKDKDVTFRLDYTLGKRFKIGVNSGLSRYDGQQADAYGADLEFSVPVSKKWIFSMDAEYKNGTNFNQYAASTTEGKRLSAYRMGGIYLTPKIRYNVNLPRIRAIRFSTRYEYFEQLTRNGNPRTSITPFLSIMFTDNYSSQLSLGVVLDKYDRQVANTRQWDANFFFAQFQLKF